MKNGIITAVFLILLSAVFYGCEKKKEEIQNIDGNESFEGKVIVNLVDAVTLQELCKSANGCTPPVLGFSGHNKNGDCVIFAITPKYVDDDATTTIGHELEHCMFGKFHKEER